LATTLEDVQAFAKAVEAKGSAGPSRKVIKALRKIESSGSEDENEESNDDGDESDVAPKRSVSLTVVFSSFCYLPL
jgi:hypothetical protein